MSKEAARDRIRPLMKQADIKSTLRAGSDVLKTGGRALAKLLRGGNADNAVDSVDPALLKRTIGEVASTFDPATRKAMTASNPWLRQGAALSPVKKYLLMGTGGAVGGGVPEYMRRRHNAQQDEALASIKKELLADKKLGWKPEDFTPEAIARSKYKQRVLAGKGYTGKKDFDLRTLISAPVGAMTANPRYWSRMFKRLNVEDLARLKLGNKQVYNKVLQKLMTKGQDVMVPVVKGTATSVALGAAPYASEIGGNVLKATKGLGKLEEAGTALTESMKSLQEAGHTAKGSAGKLDKLVEALKPLQDPRKLVREGAGEIAGGVVQGAKDQAVAFQDWLSANKEKVAAAGITAAGAYMLYRYMANRSEAKQREEEAKAEARILARALRGSR